jgi:hypothetical protein
MADIKSAQVHLIVGGFPPGASAGHDMDYARLRLLEMLQACESVRATTANDFADLERWLPGQQCADYLCRWSLS